MSSGTSTPPLEFIRVSGTSIKCTFPSAKFWSFGRIRGLFLPGLSCAYRQFLFVWKIWMQKIPYQKFRPCSGLCWSELYSWSDLYSPDRDGLNLRRCDSLLDFLPTNFDIFLDFVDWNLVNIFNLKTRFFCNFMRNWLKWSPLVLRWLLWVYWNYLL